MGPPPLTMAGWLATATEQEIRYTILMVGGISTLTGFALLKIKLQEKGEYLFSISDFTALTVATPLFLLNMAFWGYYLTSAFRLFVTLPAGQRPDWYPPMKLFFEVISVAAVSLIYLASILFAIALRKIGILSIRGSRWYIVVSIIAIILIALPPPLPEPIATISYLAAVPAIPFIMPYLIGIRLLRSTFENP